MVNVTRTRKAGMLARVAYKQVSRSRRYGAVMKALRTTTGHFRKVLGQLWLEVTGFVFLCLAAIGTMACIREYLRLQAGKSTSARVALAACFAVTFGWFGVSSFWRVRKRN